MSRTIENGFTQVFEPTPALFSRRVASTLHNLPPRRAPLRWRRLALVAAVPALAIIGVALAWQGGGPLVDRTNQSPSLAASAAAAATMAPAAASTTSTLQQTPTSTFGAHATVDPVKATPYTAKPLDPSMPKNAQAITTQRCDTYIVDAGRLTNTARACRAVDGTMIQPGSMLSFNALVGKPTQDNGYVMDSYGSATGTYGIGINHVSTALYIAAACADLDIVERHAGTAPSPYAPLGQEALVDFDTEQDLVISNPYKTPVQVSLSLQKISDAKWQVVCSLLADVMPSEVVLQTGGIDSIQPSTDIQYRTSTSVARGEYSIQEACEGQRVHTYKVYPVGINGIANRKSFTVDTYPATPKTILYNPEDPKPVLPEATVSHQTSDQTGIKVGDTVRFSSGYLLEPYPESAGSEGVETHAVPGIDYTVQDVKTPYVQITSAQNSGWIPVWYIDSDKEIKTLQNPVVRLIAKDHVALRLAPMGAATFQDSLTLDKGQAVRVIRQWQDWYCVQFVLYDAINAGERWVKKSETQAYSSAKCKEGYLRTNALCYQDDGITTLVGYWPNYNPVHIVDAHDGHYVVIGAGGFRATIKRKDFVPNPFQR